MAHSSAAASTGRPITEVDELTVTTDLLRWTPFVRATWRHTSDGRSSSVMVDLDGQIIERWAD